MWPWITSKARFLIPCTCLVCSKSKRLQNYIGNYWDLYYNPKSWGLVPEQGLMSLEPWIMNPRHCKSRWATVNFRLSSWSSRVDKGILVSLSEVPSTTFPTNKGPCPVITKGNVDAHFPLKTSQFAMSFSLFFSVWFSVFGAHIPSLTLTPNLFLEKNPTPWLRVEAWRPASPLL